MPFTRLAVPSSDRHAQIASLKEVLNKARSLADEIGDALLASMLYKTSARVERLSGEAPALEFRAPDRV